MYVVPGFKKGEEICITMLFPKTESSEICDQLWLISW